MTAYAYSWKAKEDGSREEKCTESQACCRSPENGVKDQEVRKVAIDIPEIGSQEVAGEWLIPNGEYLLVSFGAYTAADKDGKAIVKERLAIIGAEEASLANAVPVTGPTLPPRPDLRGPDTRTAPRQIAAAVPIVPSRSFPQGVHADGKPADLPKLPDDEADDTSSDSSEPMPSPQTKKPVHAQTQTQAYDRRRHGQGGVCSSQGPVTVVLRVSYRLPRAACSSCCRSSRSRSSFPSTRSFRSRSSARWLPIRKLLEPVGS